jgi:hypothetical protein
MAINAYMKKKNSKKTTPGTKQKDQGTEELII